MNRDKIIDAMTEIRRKNNRMWMRILKIAYKAEPQTMDRITKRIADYDAKVIALLRQLGSDR